MADYLVPFDNRSEEPWEEIQRRRIRSQLHEEAVRDALKEHALEIAKKKHRFEQLVRHSNHVLYSLKSVFPFDFFPNTIVIDAEKVTIKFQEFFSSGEIRSIDISNINQIYVDSGPYFATMCIYPQVVLDNSTQVIIPKLKKQEALKARRIIQGLVVAHREGINVNEIKDEQVVNKLEQIGRIQEEGL